MRTFPCDGLRDFGAVIARRRSRHQGTIPERLPNTEVEFEDVKGKVMLKPAGNTLSRGPRLVKALRGSAGPTKRGRSSDEVMTLLRGDD